MGNVYVLLYSHTDTGRLSTVQKYIVSTVPNKKMYSCHHYIVKCQENVSQFINSISQFINSIPI